jgi:hypothetical protein
MTPGLQGNDKGPGNRYGCSREMCPLGLPAPPPVVEYCGPSS